MIASRLLFNVALGLTDGLLTALVLTAGVLFHGATSVGIGQALRVAAAAALSGLFTVFVSDYARLRGELLEPAFIWPRPWTAFLAASITLATIGLALGRIVGGRSLVRAVLLLVGGAAIALTGVWLDVVS